MHGRGLIQASGLSVVLLAAAACGGGDDDGGSIAPFEFRACAAEVDYDIDGSIDRVFTYEYDDVGYPLVSEWDDDDDGTVDGVITYHYEAGDLLDYQWDIGLDGDLDYSYEATYDDHLMLTLRIDSDGDEKIDQESIFAYESDHLATIEVDLAADGMMVDGMIDVLDRVYYDGDFIARIESDYDIDGTIDNATHYDRDPEGNPVVQRTDSGNDGTDDRIDTWQYDGTGKGHVARYTMDLQPPSPLDLIQVNDWEGDDLQSTEWTTESGAYRPQLETYLYDCP